MKKKMNVKIKHSKNRLYKKRKSTGRKILEGVLLIVLIGGLGFLGYSAAGPIISFFNGETETGTVTAWTPDESLISEINSSIGTNDLSQNEKPVTTETSLNSGIGNYLLSESDLADYPTLSNALKAAKAAGYEQVLIPLKNLKGNLLYKTDMAAVKDTELVIGTMSAVQIVSAAKSAGVIPKAVIPVIYDSETSAYVEDTGFRYADDSYAWLDNYADRGGKRWNDPYLDGTKQYFSNLAKELTAAGFEQVILSQVRFPEFLPYDQTILAARNFTEDRYKLLSSLYNTVDTAADKKTAVEIDIKDVLEKYGTDYVRTAEILKDKSFSGTVYLKVTLADFGTSLQTGENSSIALPSDQVKKCTVLIEKAAQLMGTNVTVIPVINPQGISEETVKSCYEALKAE
ncbi:MAG: hypothetical protein NC203_06760 [Firmicutes bacterium]|nr:hypothetical protein [[Eubacterium] siraeum]MCM1488048.1 hypothetical protein [Bacillota bacterium]